MATDALHKRSTNEEDFHRRILQTSVHNVAEGHFRALPTTVHYHPDQNQPDSEDSDVDVDVTGMHKYPQSNSCFKLILDTICLHTYIYLKSFYDHAQS